MSLWGLGNISPFFPIILIFELLSMSVFETLSPNGQSVNFAQEALGQLDLRSLSFISGRGKRAGNYLEVESRPKIFQQAHSVLSGRGKREETRSSWFNCALRDDEALCWVSIGHYEALAVGN